MGGGVGPDRGGILGLLHVLDEHEEALRYDLFMAGRSLDDLGSPGFSWLDLRALMLWSPTTSAYARAALGNDVAQAAQLDTQLLYLLVDLIAGGNWQRSGGKGSRPKPMKRPGADKKVGGTTVMELDELDAFLGWSPRR